MKRYELDLINWANTNQGAVMVLLTLVYVAATIVIAALGWMANRISTQNLKQAIELEHQRSRPYMIFDIVIKKSLVHASLKNIGQTAARNVYVSISPKLEETAPSRPPRGCGLTERSISFIPPGQELKDFVGVFPKFFELYPSLRFEGKIRYIDSRGENHEESFLLDLAYLTGIVTISEPSTAKSVNEIAKEARALVRSVEHIRHALEARLFEKPNLSAAED